MRIWLNRIDWLVKNDREDILTSLKMALPFGIIPLILPGLGIHSILFMLFSLALLATVLSRVLPPEADKDQR